MIKGSAEWKKYRREISRKHRANHPDKVRSRIAGQVLQKKPCKVCGDLKVEFHHPDHKKPWKGEWLCKKHHEEEDTRLAKEGLND